MFLPNWLLDQFLLFYDIFALHLILLSFRWISMPSHMAASIILYVSISKSTKTKIKINVYSFYAFVSFNSRLHFILPTKGHFKSAGKLPLKANTEADCNQHAPEFCTKNATSQSWWSCFVPTARRTDFSLQFILAPFYSRLFRHRDKFAPDPCSTMTDWQLMPVSNPPDSS